MLAFGAIALAMGASVAQAETMLVQGELSSTVASLYACFQGSGAPQLVSVHLMTAKVHTLPTQNTLGLHQSKMHHHMYSTIMNDATCSSVLVGGSIRAAHNASRLVKTPRTEHLIQHIQLLQQL